MGVLATRRKDVFFKRIKPSHYTITQNPCCYGFLQENSRLGECRCMENNEDILKLCVYTKAKVNLQANAEGNVTKKLGCGGGILRLGVLRSDPETWGNPTKLFSTSKTLPGSPQVWTLGRHFLASSLWLQVLYLRHLYCIFLRTVMKKRCSDNLVLFHWRCSCPYPGL